MKKVEATVQVEAETSAQAEHDAAYVPGVISVFAKSAIRADHPAGSEQQQGVEDE